MDRIKKVFSKDEPDPEEGGIMAEVREATTLSWGTRVQAFIACFVLGLLLSLLGSGMWWLGRLKSFGILFSFGTLTSMCSTCFLMGPWNQLKKMFAPTRLIATIIVLISIALTLCAGIWWKNGALVLIFIVMQYVALAWYSISYIPFARDAVEKVVCACVE